MDPKEHAAKINEYFAQATAENPDATGLDEYEPRPTDIVVATFPKAGTTLTQQLVYQVSCALGGNAKFDPDGTNFTDICDVAPWVDYIPQMGCSWNVSEPRIFKTHARGEFFDTNKHKAVVVVRDPARFPGSWMDFAVANRPCELTMTAGEEVCRELFDHTVASKVVGTGSTAADDVLSFTPGYNFDEDRVIGPWFRFYKSWFDMANENVLFLFYEDVVRDIAGSADKVAALMGGKLTDEDRDTIVERCSRKYMGSDDRFKSVWDNVLFGIDAMSTKVQSSSNREGFTNFKLREEQMTEVNSQMKMVFGVSSYVDLRKVKS